MKETDREGRGEQEQFGPCDKHPRKIAETPSQAWYRAYESEIADKDPAQHCPECDHLALARTSAEGAAQGLITRALVGLPAQAYPRPCGLCPKQIESEADLDWHGLGNCVPVCERCSGSGIEPMAESLNSRREPVGAGRLHPIELRAWAKEWANTIRMNWGEPSEDLIGTLIEAGQEMWAAHASNDEVRRLAPHDELVIQRATEWAEIADKKHWLGHIRAQALYFAVEQRRRALAAAPATTQDQKWEKKL